MLSFTIPDCLLKPFVAMVLLYHQARFGYAYQRIPLTRGKYAIVDPEDYERLNKYKWHARKGVNTFYAGRTVRTDTKKHLIQMHREVIDPPCHLLVDHINRNGLDNRKANVRLATKSQNNLNRPYIKPKGSCSKYRGISWDKRRKKWKAQICFNSIQTKIGYFDNEIEAAKAYDKAAK